MDTEKLLDMVTDIGYELAMSGAETFRIEDTIKRITSAYNVESEIFAIPNLIIVSISDTQKAAVTRIKRIGPHGNNLDQVEKLNALSRKICADTPAPEKAILMLNEIIQQRRKFPLAVTLLGNFLGASGFSVLFGCTGLDICLSGLCGISVGIITAAMEHYKTNLFFNTLSASFVVAIISLLLKVAGIAQNTDTIIIGALMLLVPGLLFTNAMRDIIYGDTNSGVNRIVQVLLVAAAIALGTAAAFNSISKLTIIPDNSSITPISFYIQCIAAFIGCIGFAIIFNIHGPGGLICATGGMIAWFIYSIILSQTASDISGYFWAACFASVYAETMARIRKYPAISYLVVAIFPLIPGAGVYYTMNHAINGNMNLFAETGMHTAAIAGAMAVGILLISTIYRLYYTYIQYKHKKADA